MAYAAEEIGLFGSREITQGYRTIDVAGVLQLDLTNYKGSAQDIAIVTDFTDPDLNRLLRELITTYVGATYVDTRCGYGCSDHASWHLRGLPAAFPTEAAFDDVNPAMHSPYDTFDPAVDNADHALKFAKLAAAFVAEVAKGTVPPPPPPPPPDAGSTSPDAGVEAPDAGEPPDEAGDPDSPLLGCSHASPGLALALLALAASVNRRSRR
jgi:leucyl aminopeptidase